MNIITDIRELTEPVRMVLVKDKEEAKERLGDERGWYKEKGKHKASAAYLFIAQDENRPNVLPDIPGSVDRNIE